MSYPVISWFRTQRLDQRFYVPYARHYNPLSIINRKFWEFFFIIQQPKNKNSCWKCVSRHICSVICDSGPPIKFKCLSCPFWLGTLSLHSLCGWVSGPGWLHSKLYLGFFNEKIKIRIQDTKLWLFQPLTGQLTAVILIPNWLRNNSGTILFIFYMIYLLLLLVKLCE